jgi:putative holliday junction resolvase
MGKIIALDYGLARIGVAISDTSKIIASPYKTIKAEKNSSLTAQKLIDEINTLEIETIIIGLPYKLNGTVGTQGDEVRNFIKLLKKLTSIPIIEWDERLTSVQADRSMREGKMKRKKRDSKVDEIAALIILQSYLDTQGNTLLPNEFI